MKKNQINRTIHKMTFDITLLDVLKTKDNHKLSRFDAFMWLAEHILDGFPFSQKEGQLQLYKVTNSELAKLWHWSRPSVQKFTQELIDLGIIRRERFGKYFAYSLSDEAEKFIKGIDSILFNLLEYEQAATIKDRNFTLPNEELAPPNKEIGCRTKGREFYKNS